MNILFLTLDTFSKTGGIQQFNKCLQFALCKFTNEFGGQFTHMSLVDNTEQLDTRYGEPSKNFSFLGYAGQKAKFIKDLLITSHRYNIVFVGHINLSPLTLLPGLRFKDCRMIAHGVEVWSPLPVIKRRALRHMKMVLAVSRYTAGVLHRVHKIPEGKIEFFPNCLDPWLAIAPLTHSDAWNKHWRLDKQRRYIVTLARLQPSEKEKGYDTIINLLPLLAKKHPDIAYLLAGKSEESEYQRIRRLAEKKGVAQRVMMPGFVASEHLPALFSLAKVFVMPSVKEGFGIVYLEASWWGCPVVAYNAGGAKEALLNGELGTLVPAGNESALLDALDHKLSDPPLSDLEKDQLREKIDYHYGFKAFCQRVEKMLVPLT